MNSAVMRLTEAVETFEGDVESHLACDGSEEEAREILRRFEQELRGIANEFESTVEVMRAIAEGTLSLGPSDDPLTDAE